MSDLNIRREHNLNEEECRVMAEDLLGQLVEKFGGSISEEGNCFRYRHTTGMKASVEPKQGVLDINIKLNFMTRTFAPEIKKQVNRVLDKYIA